MKTVILRAPLLSASGYGVHSRQIFRWLSNRNDIKLITQIVPWGRTSWYLDPDVEKGLIGKIMACSTSISVQHHADVSVQVLLPNEWDPALAKTNIGVSAFVETDKCNPEWLACCNSMNHVVVPSSHVKETIERTGKTSTKVSVIHESFFEDVFDEDTSSLDLELSTSFNFLMVGQITGNDSNSDRKNTFGTLKWLCDAFHNDPNVGIILKTNSSRNTSIDRKNTQVMLNRFLQENRKGQYPAVYLLHGNMTTSEMVGLYRRDDVKALVNLTRGEGFGLPILEAAASGLPVVATNWSGHLDFMNLGKFIKINYSMIPIPKERVDNQIFLPNTSWAQPNEKDFKKKIKKFRNGSEAPADWAKELSVKIQKEFSQASVEEKYNKELDGYFK